MDFLKTLSEKFELFAKRAVLPSSTLAVMFFLIDYFYNSSILLYKIVEIVRLINDTTITIIFIVIAITGISYILTILTQIIFDNMIKNNYNSILYKQESKKLDKLREEVVKRLKQDNINLNIEMNDFLLFQTLGRILSYYNKPTNTSRYATDAKIGGIVYLSFLISIIWLLFLKFSTILLLVIILIISIFGFLTYEYIKSKYRSRAFRLYINYLIGEGFK